jgi:hypothetical protein
MVVVVVVVLARRAKKKTSCAQKKNPVFGRLELGRAGLRLLLDRLFHPTLRGWRKTYRP